MGDDLRVVGDAHGDRVDRGGEGVRLGELFDGPDEVKEELLLGLREGEGG